MPDMRCTKSEAFPNQGQAEANKSVPLLVVDPQVRSKSLTVGPPAPQYLAPGRC